MLSQLSYSPLLVYFPLSGVALVIGSVTYLVYAPSPLPTRALLRKKISCARSVYGPIFPWKALRLSSGQSHTWCMLLPLFRGAPCSEKNILHKFSLPVCFPQRITAPSDVCHRQTSGQVAASKIGYQFCANQGAVPRSLLAANELCCNAEWRKIGGSGWS